MVSALRRSLWLALLCVPQLGTSALRIEGHERGDDVRLEQLDTATVTNVVPAEAATPTTAATAPEASSSVPEGQSRRKLFWSLVFLVDLLHHPPCPPIGPPHDKCVAERNSDDDGESTSYSEVSSSESSSSTSGVDAMGGGVPSGLSRFQWFMLVAAAAAVAMAIMAIVAGQRRQDKRHHELTGSVARRMALFSNFCDSTLCDSNVGRPQRVVEMTMSMDDYHNADLDDDISANHRSGPTASV